MAVLDYLGSAGVWSREIDDAARRRRRHGIGTEERRQSTRSSVEKHRRLAPVAVDLHCIVAIKPEIILQLCRTMRPTT